MINFAPRSHLVSAGSWDWAKANAGILGGGMRSTRARSLVQQGCPCSHQQRRLGVFQAKVDFSSLKKNKAICIFKQKNSKLC